MPKKGRVITGARARLSIQGIKVGYTTQVTVGEDINYEPIDVLDSIETEEHVAISYKVSVSARKIRIVSETLKSIGWFPSTGKSTEEHLLNILTSGELTMVVEDTKTKRAIATVEGLKIASINYDIDRAGVVGEEIKFVARRLKDESEI